MPGFLRRFVAFTALLACIAGGVAAPQVAQSTTVRAAIHLAAVAPHLGGTATLASPAIVPGSVNRTSLALTATYDVRVRLGIAARTIRGWASITARNDSGSAIDRIELNTVMARLGGMRLGAVTVDGSPADATVNDQTIR